MDDAPNQVEVLNDTEGIVWGLYYHLWKKTHQGEPCPNVSIPHTVIYQDSTPMAWYFTSAKDNKIYRKKRSNISGPAIFEALQAHKQPKVDLCAWFSGTMSHMAASPKKRRQGSEPVYELDPQEDEKEPSCFEYCTRDRLQRLVAPGQYTAITESIYDGVLQKFITPREAYDHVIRAIWSPTACVCERRCSTAPLSDDSQPLADRMASFDANTFWLSTHQPLPAGSVLVQRITTACESLVKHLAATSAGRISVARIQLLFKVDTHNRIWLTLCNSLRLDRTVLTVDRPPSVSRQYTCRNTWKHEENTRLPQDTAQFMCVLTGETHPGSHRCDVSYKMLLQDWFMKVSELAEESDRLMAIDNIPPAIRRANPNITRDYYLRMRAQPAFLLRTAPVCSAAASALAAAAIHDLSRVITRPHSTLADSAAGHQLSTNTLNDALTRHAHLQQSRAFAAPSGALKLMLNTGPPPPPPSDPNVLYEPGQAIPAALLPKATLGSRSGAGTSPTASVLRATQHSSLSPLPSHGRHANVGLTSPRGARAPGVRPTSRVVPPPPLVAPPHARSAAPTAKVHARGGLSPGGLPAARRYIVQSPSSAASSPTPQGAGAPGRAGSASPQLLAPKQHLISTLSVADAAAVGAPAGADAAASSTALRLQVSGGQQQQQQRTTHVDSDDMRALKELSDAYASAEALTQQLLAEANSLLAEGGGPPLPALVPPSSASNRPSKAQQASEASGGTPNEPGSAGKGKPAAGGSRPSSSKPGAAAGAAATSPYAAPAGSRPSSSRPSKQAARPPSGQPHSKQADRPSAVKPAPLAALLPKAGGIGVGSEGSPADEGSPAAAAAAGVNEVPAASNPASPAATGVTAAEEASTAAGGAATAAAGGEEAAAAGAAAGEGAAPPVAPAPAGLTVAEAALLTEALQEP